MGLRNIQVVMTSVFLLGIGFSGFAQETNEQQQNLNREMTLEREYDPIVQDASKVTTLPSIREIDIIKRPITYSDYTSPMLPEKEMNILPPGRLMTEIEHAKRDGYLHLGGGMLLNLTGDFGYHILNTDRNRLGVYFSHRSTNGNVAFEDDILEPRKAKFNDNLGGLDFKHHFDRATFSLGGSFGYSMFNYYGLPTNPLPGSLSSSSRDFPAELVNYDTLSNDAKTMQANRLINVYGGISSVIPDFWGYHIVVDYANFNQKYSLSDQLDGMTEQHFGVDLGLRSRVNDGKSFGADLKVNVLSYTEPMQLCAFDSTTSTFGDPLIELDSGAFDLHYNVTLNPYFRVEGDTWKLLLGVNLMFVAQYGKIVPFASPNIKLVVPFNKRNVFYADLGGGIESNSMAQLSRVNRYVNPAFTADASKTWADLKIGVRSSAATGFWFDIFGGYRYTDSEVFFNPSSYNWIDNGFNNVSMIFQPVSQRVQGGIVLKYDYMHVVDFYLRGVYDHYTINYKGSLSERRKDDYAVKDLNFMADDELKPYGKPTFTANAGINVRPVRQLTLSLDYGMLSGIYARPYLFGLHVEPDIKMKEIHDLRFRTSWKFNDTFSIYAQFNNLLFQQQSLYFGYPLQPFSAMAGLNVSF